MKQQYMGSVNPNSCSIKTPDNSREKTIEAVRAFTTISNMGASLASDLEGTQSKLNGMYECNAMMDRQITLCAAIARGQAKNQEKIGNAWEAMRNAGFHIYNEAELGEAAIAVKNLYEDRDRLGVRCRELVEEADKANGASMKARETIEAQVIRLNGLTDQLELAKDGKKIADSLLSNGSAKIEELKALVENLTQCKDNLAKEKAHEMKWREHWSIKCDDAVGVIRQLKQEVKSLKLKLSHAKRSKR